MSRPWELTIEALDVESSPTCDDRIMFWLWLSKHFLPVTTVALETNLFGHLDPHEGRTVEELMVRTGLGCRGVTALLRVLRVCGFVIAERDKLICCDQLHHNSQGLDTEVGGTKDDRTNNNKSTAYWFRSPLADRFLSSRSHWNWLAMLNGSTGENHEKLRSILNIDATGAGVGQLWETGNLWPPQVRLSRLESSSFYYYYYYYLLFARLTVLCFYIFAICTTGCCNDGAVPFSFSECSRCVCNNFETTQPCPSHDLHLLL